MNNRMYNCKNPYQGSAKKVLCVCSAGLLRSPTAANVLHREYGYNTRSCGYDVGHALIPFDKVLGEWADEIVVMEPWIAQALKADYGDAVICLDIKDSYDYMDPTLQQLIKEKYEKLSQRS